MAASEKYLFVQRDTQSSVYTAVAKHLVDRGDWKKQPRDSTRFNLMLGDRNKLPWHKLGQIPGLIQVVNYYRSSEALCRKSSMTRILKEHCKKTRQAQFAWLPKSFVLVAKLTPGQNVHPVKQLAATARSDDRAELRQLSNQSANSDTLWIVKSSSGSKGEGIKISSNVEELISYVDDQEKAFVCQQYIHPPLLLPHQRKFDIRSWVLVDLHYNIYLYREGVLRTSSESYTDDVNDIAAHLTNHSLQEQLSENFGRYEKGNEMFFDQFDRFLRKTYSVGLESKILPQIRSIIKTCLLIIQEQISTFSTDYWSFQLFGFDFMIDENFHVWLLEINGAPACASKLLPDMVRCIVETAIDPAFPPQVAVRYQENLFERI